MRPGIDTLTALPLLAAFSPSQIATLNEAADLARVGPDELLFRAGESPSELTILLSGYAVETKPQPKGEALTDVIAPVTPLAFAPAVLDVPSPTEVRTITSARLVLLPAADLRRMIGTEPALALPFLSHALRTLHEQSGEIIRLKLRSSVQRLAEFLLGLVPDPEMTPARFVLPYEKRFLAARIGCSQENLSRAFAALRRMGVESERGIVVLRNVPVLRAYVDQGRRDPHG